MRPITTRMMSVAFLGLGLSFLPRAVASHWFRVPDASQLRWLLDSSEHVYLRNLNSFDSTVLGCCYNYYLDLTTNLGRQQWASLQVRMANGSSVWISVNSQTQSGAIDFVADLD